jgi:hypothetical protein
MGVLLEKLVPRVSTAMTPGVAPRWLRQTSIRCCRRVEEEAIGQPRVFPEQRLRQCGSVKTLWK